MSCFNYETHSLSLLFHHHRYLHFLSSHPCRSFSVVNSKLMLGVYLAMVTSKSIKKKELAIWEKAMLKDLA